MKLKRKFEFLWNDTDQNTRLIDGETLGQTGITDISAVSVRTHANVVAIGCETMDGLADMIKLTTDKCNESDQSRFLLGLRTAIHKYIG